ncbi:hypothetical protein ACFP81_03485 [Deinococcus lacus]|uniref:Uncharacterized protein n=1 Tax=Deinococcus lacus TaxID=392561 RepID=A0ABW1YB31_9DEIO
MTTVLTVTLALVLGGGGMPPQVTPASPTLTSTAPARPAVAPLQPTGPVIVPVTLHIQESCHAAQAPSLCPSGDLALSGEQVQMLAQLFGIKAKFRPVQAGEVGPQLELSASIGWVGSTGTQLSPQYEEGHVSYYSAGDVLAFIARVTPGARFTAVPHFTLQTSRATLDMGAVSPERLRQLFSGFSHAADKVFPREALSCDGAGSCTYSGITIILLGEQPQRLQTGLKAGEVALLVVGGRNRASQNDLASLLRLAS